MPSAIWLRGTLCRELSRLVLEDHRQLDAELDRARRTAEPRALGVQLAAHLDDLLERHPDRVERVPELRRAAACGPARAGDPDWRMGALHGLRRERGALAGVEPAFVGDGVVRPELLHQRERVVGARPPVREVLPEDLELLLEPADADPEDEPAAGELVHLRDLLRDLERVVHREHDDARAQPDAPGVGGEEGEHGEGLPVAFAPVRRVHPAGNQDVARALLRRENHVGAEEQRVQLERLGALGDPDEGVRGGVLTTHDQGAAEFHREPLR